MVSPGSLQNDWTYLECGIPYNLGVDDDVYVQYLSTTDEAVTLGFEIRVGTTYKQVRKRAEKEALYHRGFMHAST